MYRAKIIDSSFDSGKVVVKIQYYVDGGGSFTETISSSQEQKKEWIDDSIQRRLKSLNQLPEIVDYANSKKEVEIVQSENILGLEQEEMEEMERAEYRNDLEKFERYVRALTKGMTDEQNANFIALKKKLKDNFKDEYLDMF